MNEIVKNNNSEKFIFTPKQVSYINWLANPNRKGTKEAIAKSKFNYSYRALRKWEQLPGFWDLVWDRFVNYYLQGELPEVNQILIRKAKDGDMQAINKVYEIAGKILENQTSQQVNNYFVQIINNFKDEDGSSNKIDGKNP